MQQWLQDIAFQKLTTQQLRWVFKGLLVVTIIDWLMPDALPFVDELGLAWLTYEAWVALKARKNASRDVKGEEI
ncbi:hypothetical protein COV06_00065 [Candidatus Uhrbacteria bacterium CG10_big_fil_rev_8_21_14_0_10_50_16]|uniref:Uncharacterized protein n=1 Tax=Candidatus Uhrbacteria bacterium CG10_big_fil_rev_8_21_14_0_10_50_16 TaxID=1975039 RepID=A0A2H0RMW3_9BACT|nr:MAG: hypothetical protein COV06_00065 [Candidatus Uhrbacteria bacterium CG10_big_fil_rev_8_21_14_0_10_50_16]